MKIDSFVRLLAGSMILLSLALALSVNHWWFLLTAFIGLNLTQSALTGFCPPIAMLRWLGWLDSEGVIRWGGVKRTG